MMADDAGTSGSSSDSGHDGSIFKPIEVSTLIIWSYCLVGFPRPLRASVGGIEESVVFGRPIDR